MIEKLYAVIDLSSPAEKNAMLTLESQVLVAKIMEHVRKSP